MGGGAGWGGGQAQDFGLRHTFTIKSVMPTRRLHEDDDQVAHPSDTTPHLG